MELAGACPTPCPRKGGWVVNPLTAGRQGFNNPMRTPMTTSTFSSPLPSPETERWSPRRKAAVITAMRTGLLSRQEACDRYLLSLEELAVWEAKFDANGVPGLRLTRHQIYRDTSPGKARDRVPHF